MGSSPPRTRHPRAGDLALVVAAVCFGSTFIAVQGAVERVEPIPFLAVRFLLGAAALWPLARRRPSGPHLWRDGSVAGAALLVGYILQTTGLQYTSSATSAFITYLLVVFVPVLAFALLGRQRCRGRVREGRAPHPRVRGGLRRPRRDPGRDRPPPRPDPSGPGA